MKQLSLVFATCFTLLFNAVHAQDTKLIKQTLLDWNKAVMTKNVELATSIFDNNAQVIFVGSEKNEIFKGMLEIRHSIEKQFMEDQEKLNKNLSERMGILDE